MKFNIQIKKTHFAVLLVAYFVLAGAFVAWAYRTGGPPNYSGHSAEELEVNISGNIMTLQQAIDNNFFGSQFNITNFLDSPGRVYMKKANTHSGSGTVSCNSNDKILGGGFLIQPNNADNWALVNRQQGTSWQCVFREAVGKGSTTDLECYVTCLNMTS